MTKDEAREVMAYFIGRVGLGFHSDTPLHEYICVDKDNKAMYGKPTFTEQERDKLQPLYDKAFEVLEGPESYDIAIRLRRIEDREWFSEHSIDGVMLDYYSTSKIKDNWKVYLHGVKIGQLHNCDGDIGGSLGDWNETPVFDAACDIAKKYWWPGQD